MGQMKESNMKTEALEDSAKLKGEANDAFKALKYEETLAKYTKVEDLMENTNLKSRAAVYIKNKNDDKAVDDCRAVLE